MKIKIVLWISFLSIMLVYALFSYALAYHDDIPLGVIEAKAQLSRKAIEVLGEDLNSEKEMLSWGINVKAIGEIQKQKKRLLPLKADLLRKLNQQFTDFFSEEIKYLSQDIEKDRFIVKLNRWRSNRRRLVRGKIRVSLPEKQTVIDGLKEKLLSLEESLEERKKKW